MGDLTGIIGFIITIIGFFVTIARVESSKKAAYKAELAARSASERIRTLETVVDFASAIALLEEIKRSHRQEQWVLLPDRYATIRRMLISLRISNHNLSEDHKTVIQSALTNMATIERRVEQSLPDTTSLKSARINSTISDDIDNLVAVLEEIKIAGSGVRNV